MLIISLFRVIIIRLPKITFCPAVVYGVISQKIALSSKVDKGTQQNTESAQVSWLVWEAGKLDSLRFALEVGVTVQAARHTERTVGGGVCGVAT